MSLLNKASLIQIPSGYKDGTLYSAKPTNGDGDFTFSRGSNLAATRVNSDGLIEKGRENLLLQSNQFDTTWVTANSSVTSGQSGYDGSNDAWLLDKSGASGRITQTKSVTGIFTFSVYVKKGTTDWILLYKTGTGEGGRFFDLTNGVTGSSISTAPIDSKIESIGNDWYRCSIVGNSANAVVMYVADSDGGLTDTSGNIYIQDSQLESGLVATDYIETGASTAQAGILEDMPRLDYSGGSCPSLLLEPQRSNLVTQSEYIGAWTLNNVLITNNDTTSPEGLDNAAKWSASSGLSQKNIYQVLTCSSGVAHTTSVYFKADEYPLALIRLGGITDSPYVIYDLRDESVVSTSGLTSHTIESVSNDWYRIDATATTTGTVIAPNFAFLPESGYTLTSLNIPQYTGDGTSGGHIYGAMVEAGSYSTSLIPTYGASVTRGADSCIKTGISSLIGQTEGTIFADFVFNGNPTSVDYSIFIIGAIGSNYITIGGYNTSLYARVFDSTLQATINALSMVKGTRYKVAVAYANNDVVMYVNGVNEGSDTSASIPTLSQCSFSRPSFEAKTDINNALLFKTRLSNDELASLTTL